MSYWGKVKIDRADKMFSLYVRTRDNWTCQRCFKKYPVGSQGLHASHYFGRSKESTRFDPLNVTSHCYGCHQYLTSHPQEHHDWKLKQLGQKEFDLLQVRAATYQKKDRAMSYLIATELYKSLESR